MHCYKANRDLLEQEKIPCMQSTIGWVISAANNSLHLQKFGCALQVLLAQSRLVGLVPVFPGEPPRGTHPRIGYKLFRFLYLICHICVLFTGNLYCGTVNFLSIVLFSLAL
ncbi:uncharacterized protein TM35_000131980 [Trypanosoma theileri]|uniref:Uncharacterized protein n=1 Tax=Trypanosoma theileri TaxID=67003 RepID=A0A1X0NWW7_9TRYP|nr:uncharacterized protein TM35_000131980 [Trypanosoma theileri]ORC89194.1 hypothetical protein TM35_000131980 [Trypanosoma theileri]